MAHTSRAQAVLDQAAALRRRAAESRFSHSLTSTSRMYAEAESARLNQEAALLERSVLIPFKPIRTFELEAWSCAERTRLAEREQFLNNPDACPRLKRALRHLIEFEQTGRWPNQRAQP